MTENCFSSESFFFVWNGLYVYKKLGGGGHPPSPSGKQQLNASRVFFPTDFI